MSGEAGTVRLHRVLRRARAMPARLASMCRTALALSVLLASAPSVFAVCPGDAEVQAYLAEFAAPRPNETYARGLSLADAECARGRLVEALPAALGRIVGYKAGFTNAAVQQRLGVDGPAWGVLFDRHLYRSAEHVPAGIGARLYYEVDLIAVVKDGGLAEAKTPLEALDHIAAFEPFIELVDMMAENALTGTEVIARNIGFRGGVRGPAVLVEPGQAFLDALAGVNAVLTDDRTGAELGRGRGDVLLGHPVNAAMWLAQALARAGTRLEAGDLLSLGALVPMKAVDPGAKVTATYQGLPGDPRVRVVFE